MSRGARQSPGPGDPDHARTQTPFDVVMDDGEPVSPMLTQSVQSGGAAARTGGVIKVGGRKRDVSLLTHSLPESTSYAGNHLVALQRPASDFRAPPGTDFQLEFDGTSTYVECGCPVQLRRAVQGAHMTIEAWVRPRSRDGLQFIVAVGQTANAHVQTWLRINDGHYEFGCWNGTYFGISKDLEPPAAGFANAAASTVWQSETYVDPKLIRMPAEDIDSWVHLAGVFDGIAGTWTLYRNGAMLATSKARRTSQMQGDHAWFIGAVRDGHPTPGMRRFFKGAIAEVRIWTTPRNREEISGAMYTAAPPATGEVLGGLWRLNEGSGTVARDLSRHHCNGTIRSAANAAPPKWVFGDAPAGELPPVHGARNASRVEQAFNAAKTSGLFDPIVFPRVRAPLSEADRQRAITDLRDISFETFKAFHETGHHLVLRRTFAGGLSHAFVPSPQKVQPKLFLIEEYRLSSFLGAYGFGRTLKTFSLLPGESARLSVRTSSRNDATARQCSSILDSYTKESAAEFESSLAQQHAREFAGHEEHSYDVPTSGNPTWGMAGVIADVGHAGSIESTREEFGKAVCSATLKHAAMASANRNVRIEPSSQATRPEEPGGELIRDIENLNVGHTLNYVFRQMNQEFITLLHLVDIRIGFTSGLEPVREAPLYELDSVLARMLVDDADVVADVRRFVLNEVAAIRDYCGVEQRGFVSPVDPAEAQVRYRVNRDFTTTYRDATSGTRRTVPGIVIAAKSVVMRTEDVVVEALIGLSPALDKYAEELQAEEIRTKRLENDRLQRQNRLLELEAQKQVVLLDLVRERELELLRAYGSAADGVTRGEPTRHANGSFTPGAVSPSDSG